MKSKIFTVAASGLINGVIEEIDVTLNITNYVVAGNTIEENKIYYPTQMVITNESSKKVGYVILASEAEEEIYSQRPEWFDFIPLKSKIQANSNVAPRAYKVLLKCDDFVNSGYVEILCIGYSKT